MFSRFKTERMSIALVCSASRGKSGWSGGVRKCIGVGDEGQGGSCPLPQIRAKTIFWGKNRVKFGHFVNFSCIYFRAKMSCPPKVDWAPTPMRKCQTPLHGHRLRICCKCTTPPTDKLTTITCCTINLPHRNARAHVKMLGCGKFFVCWWWICCTTSCRIVVSSPVGGVVQHVRSRYPCSGVWH